MTHLKIKQKEKIRWGLVLSTGNCLVCDKGILWSHVDGGSVTLKNWGRPSLLFTILIIVTNMFFRVNCFFLAYTNILSVYSMCAQIQFEMAKWITLLQANSLMQYFRSQTPCLCIFTNKIGSLQHVWRAVENIRLITDNSSESSSVDVTLDCVCEDIMTEIQQMITL